MKLRSSNISNLKAVSLCSSSFLPEELPPCFHSRAFGAWAGKLSTSQRRALLEKGETRFQVEQIDTYGARYGGLIRRHSAPSPNAFVKLCLEFEKSNKELTHHLEESIISASKPTTSHKYRGLGLTYRFNELQNLKKSFCKNRPWLLKADIANCYPSIYTHSLSWAIHGKVHAKEKMRDWSMLGNRIDRFVMDCQYGETKGIPVGPDTSRLLSEVILTAIDTEMSGEGTTGFRFMDDFWFFCESEEEAQDRLGALQIELMKYRLNVSVSKTKVAKHESSFEDGWVKIARKEIPRTSHSQRDIDKYRNLLSKFIAEYPQTPAVKYVFSSIKNNVVRSKIDVSVINLMLDYVDCEPSLIPELIRFLITTKTLGKFEIAIQERLENLIPRCIRMAHHIELAWILWLALDRGWKISKEFMVEASKLESNFITLLIMSHVEKDLCEEIDFPVLNEVHLLHEEPNYLSNWLFRYECASKGWLDPAPLKNLGLSELYDEGVNFFNEDIGDGSWFARSAGYI